MTDNYDGYKRVDPNVEADIEHIQKAVSEGCLAYVGDTLTPESIAVLRDEVESVARKIIAEVSLHSYTNDIHVECEHDGQTGVLKFSASANNARGQAVIQQWLDTVDKL